MLLAAALVVAALAASAAASPLPWASSSMTPLPRAKIEAAFAGDGFRVMRWVSMPNNSAAEACVAESLAATNLCTGLPKRTYYATGSAYEMGYLTGLLTPNETA